MFEELCDENDLEWTVHRLRVEVLTLKKSGDLESLFRLYGTLARIFARRGDALDAQDALNDAEFLVVEHHWRGTKNEIWGHYDRALAFQELGRPEIALRNLNRAEELLQENNDSVIEEKVRAAKEALSFDD